MFRRVHWSVSLWAIFNYSSRKTCISNRRCSRGFSYQRYRSPILWQRWCRHEVARPSTISATTTATTPTPTTTTTPMYVIILPLHFSYMRNYLGYIKGKAAGGKQLIDCSFKLVIAVWLPNMIRHLTFQYWKSQWSCAISWSWPKWDQYAAMTQWTKTVHKYTSKNCIYRAVVIRILPKKLDAVLLCIWW